jgi:hypothetical protein
MTALLPSTLFLLHLLPAQHLDNGFPFHLSGLFFQKDVRWEIKTPETPLVITCFLGYRDFVDMSDRTFERPLRMH